MKKIDVVQLLEQTDNDWKLLREAFSILCQQIPIEMSQLEAALASDDARRAAFSAHTIRGMWSNFFATDACAAALAIELSAQENDLANRIQLFSRLQDETEQAQSELNQILQNKGA